MTVRVALACLLIAAGALSAEVAAQGYVQPRYGASWGQSVSVPYRLPPTSPYAASGAYSRYQFGGGADLVYGGGTYRTLCVRLCDGFYFPISYATTGSGVSRDADKCEAACGTQGRLFFHQNPGGDVETMVDLTGQAYSAQSFAFKYRKTLVQGCACRPQPGTETELSRRDDDSADAASGESAPVTFGAADQGAPSRNGADINAGGGIVVRPQPVARNADVRATWPFNAWATPGPAGMSRYRWPGER